MGRRLWLTALCAAILLLSGCWDRRELNEISVITGMAVDKGEHHKYRLTIEGLNSAALDPKTGGDAAPAVVFEMEGESIADLTLKMNVGVSRHLIYSHLQTVIIGEDIAKDGIFEFLDLLERSREIRNDFNVVIASGVSASDVLKVTYPVQKASSLKIGTQLRTIVKDWGGSSIIRLSALIQALVSPGREPTVAIVRVQGDPEKGRSVQNMKKVDPDAMVVVGGLAVFRNKEYVGKLSTEDIPSVMWLQDELQRTSIAVACGPDRYFTAAVINSDTQIVSSYRGGRPHFDVAISLDARLEGMACDDDLSNKETYITLEEKLTKTVDERVSSVIDRLQHEYEADILGFGEVMERQHYKQFSKLKKDWNEHFARSDIEVTVEAKLRSVGLVNKSFLSDTKD